MSNILYYKKIKRKPAIDTAPQCSWTPVYPANSILHVFTILWAAYDLKIVSLHILQILLHKALQTYGVQAFKRDTEMVIFYFSLKMY